MKTKLFAVSALAVTLAAGSAARAGTAWSVSVGVGGPGYAGAVTVGSPWAPPPVYQPAPVCAPVRVYAPPAVVYAPAPVVYYPAAPAPMVVAAPYYWGGPVVVAAPYCRPAYVRPGHGPGYHHGGWR